MPLLDFINMIIILTFYNFKLVCKKTYQNNSVRVGQRLQEILFWQWAPFETWIDHKIDNAQSIQKYTDAQKIDYHAFRTKFVSHTVATIAAKMF